MLEKGIPSHDTFNRVFQMIDPKKLHEAFQTWVNGIITKLEGVVAIDGKTIRRSKEEISQTKPAHIVSAWANSLFMVLDQVKVDEKSNEITAIPELLKTLSQDHGRIETREYYLENEIDWMKDAKKVRLGQGISVSCAEQAELKNILFSEKSGNRVCLLYNFKQTIYTNPQKIRQMHKEKGLLDMIRTAKEIL